ncbi:MAG TPA: helix-turn-helix domain-containing protein [Eoetvoesiella sp.]
MSTLTTPPSEFHVLIIDDNPDQLRLLVEALRATNIRLSVAFDGMQGYDRALAVLPDLILLDVRMPRMDGFTLCRWLKANSATAHIPIIFLSSASDLSERLTGLRDGGVDYILKPFVPEEVVARVQVHLRLAGKGEVNLHDEAGKGLDDNQVLVRAAQRQLQACLSETPHIDELADQLGVSEKRLSRAFRKSLDMTMFEYLRQERMKVAQRLLTQTSLSIAAISNEVGFSSAANFATAFRDQVGVSPSEFRRSRAI